MSYRSHRHRHAKPCHTGSSTTTHAGHTAGSATSHPSAAFTTYVGRTASCALDAPTLGARPSLAACVGDVCVVFARACAIVSTVYTMAIAAGFRQCPPHVAPREHSHQLSSHTPISPLSSPSTPSTPSSIPSSIDAKPRRPPVAGSPGRRRVVRTVSSPSRTRRRPISRRSAREPRRRAQLPPAARDRQGWRARTAR